MTEEIYTEDQFEEWKRLWNEAVEVAYSLEEIQRLMLLQAARMFSSSENWQSIETAPKDGTTIVVGHINGTVGLAYWSEEKGGHWFDDRVPYWYHPDPTHWQPLPAAPDNK